ncbi:MAG: Xaa-Pro peptidase family protein [Ahrensia sp.]
MTPPRGFTTAEFEARTARAQALMAQAGLDALLLTTEPEVRYFTGYLTRFWESPTRPWFLLVPASGKPVAVIPSIGAWLMGTTWLDDIRTWQAPDLSDDGVSLLAHTLREQVPSTGKIGVPSGHETHLRMPLADYHRLAAQLDGRALCDDAAIMRRLRLVKSTAEIDKIRHACTIAGDAFAAVPDFARQGVALDECFRRFQMACLEHGADWVSYTAGGAGRDGYGDVISPATSQPLETGDILMIDTGLVWDGYFCDYDRNFAIGTPSTTSINAHTRLMQAVDAGLATAKPGATASDLYHAMDKVLTGGKADPAGGRLGHGLGMQLTEWPSLIASDHTELEPGMVLTLEPGIETVDGRIMVHEENIVITQTGAEFLSPRAGEQLVVCDNT